MAGTVDPLERPRLAHRGEEVPRFVERVIAENVTAWKHAMAAAGVVDIIGAALTRAASEQAAGGVDFDAFEHSLNEAIERMLAQPEIVARFGWGRVLERIGVPAIRALLRISGDDPSRAGLVDPGFDRWTSAGNAVVRWLITDRDAQAMRDELRPDQLWVRVDAVSTYEMHELASVVQMHRRLMGRRLGRPGRPSSPDNLGLARWYAEQVPRPDNRAVLREAHDRGMWLQHKNVNGAVRAAITRLRRVTVSS